MTSGISGECSSTWIRRNPSPTAGGVRVTPDHKAVPLYWKGTPPTALQQLAKEQSVPVTIQGATYSLDER
jgi:hypothetical protein